MIPVNQLVINENSPTNMLSWADDLVLLSETRQGLQICIDKLEKYCCKWGSTFDSKKPKCIIFSKGVTHNADFEI